MVRGYVGGLRKNISNPFVLGMIVFCVAYFIVPPLGYWSGAYRFQESYSLRAHTMYLIGMLMFWLSAFLTYALGKGRRHYVRAKIQVLSLNRWSYLRYGEVWLAAVLLVIPGLVSLAWMLHRTSVVGYNEYMANRIVMNSGLGYLLMPIGWLGVFLVLFYCNALIRHKTAGSGMNLPVLGVVLLSCMGAALLLGSRSRALWPLLYLSMTYIFLRGGPVLSSRRAFRVGMLGVVLLVVGSVLGNVRQQISSGATLGEVQLRMGQDVAAAGILNVYGEYENVLWLLENQRETDLLWGRTFAAVIVGAVPRSIWRNKPVGGGPYLRNMIHPGSYNLDTGRGLTSYTTGLPAEAFMNFGMAGFTVLGVVYGLALWVMTVVLSWVASPLAFTTWFFGLVRLVGVLGAEVFGTVSHLFSAIVPLVAVAVLLRVLRAVSPRRRSRVILAGSPALARSYRQAPQRRSW